MIKTGCPFSLNTLRLFLCCLDGLRDHLRDVPWEDNFEFSASAAFVNGFRLELMCIFLIINIRSSLNHLRGFQLLLLLP